MKEELIRRRKKEEISEITEDIYNIWKITKTLTEGKQNNKTSLFKEKIVVVSDKEKAEPFVDNFVFHPIR